MQGGGKGGGGGGEGMFGQPFLKMAQSIIGSSLIWYQILIMAFSAQWLYPNIEYLEGRENMSREGVGETTVNEGPQISGGKIKEEHNISIFIMSYINSHMTAVTKGV